MSPGRSPKCRWVSPIKLYDDWCGYKEGKPMQKQQFYQTFKVSTGLDFQFSGTRQYIPLKRKRAEAIDKGSPADEELKDKASSDDPVDLRKRKASDAWALENLLSVEEVGYDELNI